jgi:hypothetical protein
MKSSSYDKHPLVSVPDSAGRCVRGWGAIADRLRTAIEARRAPRTVLVVDCYPGVNEAWVDRQLATRLTPALVLQAAEALRPPPSIESLVSPFLGGDDPVFGFLSPLLLPEFFDADRVAAMCRDLESIGRGLVLVVGCGARLLHPGDILVYADLARWEAQLRFRRGESGNLGAHNHPAPAPEKYKRAYFVDWCVGDRWKQPLLTRWDFLLDTMGGGNLSLQVHPRADYLRRHFGLGYTQDESYYLLDAGPGASVFPGLGAGVDRSAMAGDLRAAQGGGPGFPADRYVARWPAKKHDHFLIPAGTVHASGAQAMVLEISATPYIFTFKLWDWGRLGLDGRPRPIHLDHGLANVQWDRDAAWVETRLVNRVTPLARGDGWREERTGLHESQFVETRRHWFTGSVPHDTAGGVNVLNLVEGAAAVVESPVAAFDPFPVHFAETFSF